MPIKQDLLLVLKSSSLGEGEIDLGETLLEKFLITLFESGNLPARIICMNSAIFLTTEGSRFNDILRKFGEEGTAVLSCLTCLEYYGRKDKLIVGAPSTMKDTVTAMLTFGKVLSL
jgi:selenium metabolism protein YedF